MKKKGKTPMEVLRKPHEHSEENRLTQAMLNYDELFVKWRYTHLRLVTRIIGLRVKSLKGVPGAWRLFTVTST